MDRIDLLNWYLLSNRPAEKVSEPQYAIKHPLLAIQVILPSTFPSQAFPYQAMLYVPRHHHNHKPRHHNLYPRSLPLPPSLLPPTHPPHLHLLLLRPQNPPPLTKHIREQRIKPGHIRRQHRPQSPPKLLIHLARLRDSLVDEPGFARDAEGVEDEEGVVSVWC